jgi:hypothetical protein
MVKSNFLSAILIFFCGVSAAQTLDWVKGIGDGGFLQVEDFTFDDSGYVYIIGQFENTNDFDPGSGVFEMTATGSSEDVFLAKFDGFGNFKWAKQFTGNSNEKGYGIVVDAAGNLYACGSFGSTVDFDPSTNAFSLVNNGVDGFVCKLSSDGSFIWVKQITGTNTEYASAITKDLNQDIYLTGITYGATDFDPGPSVINLDYGGFQDVFVLKIDTAGTYIWARALIGPNTQWVRDIATDKFGNVFTTGHFRGDADFDPGLGVYNLSTSGIPDADIFVWKLEGTGDFGWAKHMSGPDSGDDGRSIVTDTSGNIYTTGFITSATDFDPGTDTFALVPLGQDAFILKLDPMGDFLWAKLIGGNGDDIGGAITTDLLGNSYTSGGFSDTVDFDPGIDTVVLISQGLGNAFMLKLDPMGVYDYAAQFASQVSSGAGDIFVDSVSNIYIAGSFNGQTDFDIGYDTMFLTSIGADANIYLSKIVQCTGLPSYSSIAIVVCNDYTSPSGQYVFTSSGIYQDTLLNASGCDSIITINLTLNSSSSFLSPFVCDEFISPSGNYVWTVNGTYYDTIPNLAGCDSLITINLTILNSFSYVDTIVCQSYEAPSSLFTWDSTGIYMDTIPNTAGCDSIITINLIVEPSSGTLNTYVVQNLNLLEADLIGASYQWLDCSNFLTPILGENSFQFVANTVGNYAVEISLDGCIDTSFCVNILPSDFYSLPGFIPLSAEVFPLPISNMGACNAQAFAFISGGISPYATEWSNDFYSNNLLISDSICFGFYSLKVYDNIGDSVQIPFYITDSINYYNWYSPTTVVDTLYTNSANCIIDYTLPIDSISLSNFYFLYPDLLSDGDYYFIEMTYYQSGNIYTNSDTLLVSLVGDQLIMFAVWCPSKTNSTIKIINFSFSFPDVLSISEYPRLINAKIYPNPSNNSIHIDDLEFDEVLIVDLTGKQVLRDKTKHKSIDISQVSTGIYLIHLLKEGKIIFSDKLIVSKS